MLSNPASLYISVFATQFKATPPEYAKFFGVKPKNGNVNLKADSTTKNRIVAVDVPYTAPKNRGGQGGNSSSSITTKQSDPDSVNSTELMLNTIEK